MTDPNPTAAPTKGLHVKLTEVMAEVGRVPKAGYNSFHKYHYVTEADLVESVRQRLAERHVMLLASVDGMEERPYTTDKGKASVVTTARMTFTFVDGDTGETVAMPWAGQGDDAADKGLYKALTGATKYFLMKTFLIATGDDPERESGGKQAEPAPVAIGPDVAAELRRLWSKSGVTDEWMQHTLGLIGVACDASPVAISATLGRVTPDQAAWLTNGLRRTIEQAPAPVVA